MDDRRIDKLDEKLDKVIDRISSIDVTLARQAVSLDEHIKRTNLLEKKLEPVEKHVIAVHTIMKVIGILATLAGAGHGVSKMLGLY